jgi:hypothetical protein
MFKLLALEMEEDFVKAHVLERLARVAAGETNFQVGKLIVRLNAGDPAPAMRCEACLKVDCKCGRTCPDCGQDLDFCYCDIIKR